MDVRQEAFTVKTYDCQSDAHVNNTEYIRWSLDALKSAFEFPGPIRSLKATYFAELFEADSLDLLLTADPDAGFQVLGRKAQDQTNVFALKIRT